MTLHLDEAALAGLRARARDVLRRNDRGGYTVPTDGLYPFQWNWDSAFCAMGFATFDEIRAWRELERLFEGQWPDGLVPHIIFHQPADSYFPGPDVWGARHVPPTSGITQPPVAATAARHLFDHASDRALAEARARALYPKLLAWHDWWATARDPEGRGLVAVLHNWETGMDNSPTWDSPMSAVPATTTSYRRLDTRHVDGSMRPEKSEYDRYVHLLEVYRGVGWEPAAMWRAAPFRVVDVGINAILLRAERDLAALARALGRTADCDRLEHRIERSASALESLWNPATGLYHGRDLIADRPIEAQTSAGLLPIHAGIADRNRVAALAATLRGWRDQARYAAPSTPPNAAAFDARRYWRGPVWAIVNWLLGEGFAAHGQAELAQTLRRDTLELIARGGFAEYFDPTDGTPCGGGEFSWTAAALLAYAAPARGRDEEGAVAAA